MSTPIEHTLVLRLGVLAEAALRHPAVAGGAPAGLLRPRCGGLLRVAPGEEEEEIVVELLHPRFEARLVYTTADNADRRASYLTTTSELLLGHLQGLIDAWAPDTPDNYRAEMESIDPALGLQRILTGMIVLSGFETAGERLQAALDAGDQEEEHSCFSDNTHDDMIYDVLGVQNVWEGAYVRTDGTSVTGTGIEAVVRELDASLADELDARVQTSVDLARALEPPFDLEIQPGNAEGNARVQALIDSLRTQEMLLTQVFVELGFTVPDPE